MHPGVVAESEVCTVSLLYQKPEGIWIVSYTGIHGRKRVYSRITFKTGDFKLPSARAHGCKGPLEGTREVFSEVRIGDAQGLCLQSPSSL